MRRLFVPLLAKKQNRILRALILLYGASEVAFFAWWLGGPRTHSNIYGYSITTFVIAYVHFSFWYYLFFASRMKKINPSIRIPKFRTALITTRVPSAEPFEVTKKTLNAMLKQTYRYGYDVWLADEDPDKEVRKWCKQHGVKISTRKNKPAYHQPVWPRRTKSKEGNLAYFYDTYGYKKYDIVFQFDADHVPEKDYVKNAIKAYSDDSIGYVAAPSICDSNAAHSWSARGRLYVEASMHGSYQMGLNGDFMPHCIGSHYSVRTKALKQIGGIGPELAEDFSTTYAMTTHGWNGAFAHNAIAHGDGPLTFADCMKQEFQWSRSLMNLALSVVPKTVTKLPFKKRFQVINALAWYPMLVIMSLLSYAMPLYAIITNAPIVTINYYNFLFYSTVQLCVVMAIVAWLRNQKVFRPVHAKILSWESAFYLLARWPYITWGLIYSLIDTYSKRPFVFKITPKHKIGINELHIIKTIGYVLLVTVPILVTTLFGDRMKVAGYYYLSLVGSVSYAALTSLIVIRHFKEAKEPVLALGGSAKILMILSLIGICALGIITAKEEIVVLVTSTFGAL